MLYMFIYRVSRTTRPNPCVQVEDVKLTIATLATHEGRGVNNSARA